MKILHVIAALYPERGGPAKVGPEMCHALAKKGVDVSIYTTNLNISGTLDIPTDRAVVQDGVPVHYFPIRGLRQYGFSLPIAEDRIVGDKFHYYVFILNRLVEIDDLARVIIYRDARDIASSSLLLVSSFNQPWVRFFNTAEKVARQWVRAIECMEQHADKVHSIRYESLVSQPEVEIDKLSVYLGVDASGSSLDLVHNNSIGKYKHGLRQDELVTINDICGPTMSRLGYS